MNGPILYLVEGYGGEVESRFIHVVATDEVGAEQKARKQLDPRYYPYMATDRVTEVDGYKITLENEWS